MAMQVDPQRVETSVSEAEKARYINLVKEGLRGIRPNANEVSGYHFLRIISGAWGIATTGLLAYETGEMIYASFNDALKQYRINDSKQQIIFREILKKEPGQKRKRTDVIDNLVTEAKFPDKPENIQELGRKIYFPSPEYTGSDEETRELLKRALDKSKEDAYGVGDLVKVWNPINIKEKSLLTENRRLPTRDAGLLIWTALNVGPKLIQRGGRVLEETAPLLEKLKALKSAAILSNISCHRRENVVYQKSPSISGKTNIAPYLAWLAARTMNLSDGEKMNMNKSNDPAGLLKCISILKGNQAGVGHKGKQNGIV
ncbi:unnamed protein product [Owenia fusiformis]|uniref:Uncharacterized protein n=1 Tax=Owenia fusiformis TaxID=6347 RepID=A0A8S4NCD8_OWEFU|nr:unnamed protein product [Owenia fusiformis]